ncbi:MAG: hypothetical protein IT380_14535 [Myxococcales bacterium]|nr:hypothetical protein [Myxococcales bacterium]
MPHSSRIALLSVALCSSAALATVVIAQSVEDLTRGSPLVVRATAQQSMAAFDEGEAKIWTWTELTVTETLKGQAPRTLLVKQPGGEVGGLGQHVAGVARFRPGEDCVLFLEPSADERGVFIVRGLSAGKVSLSHRLGKVLAVRDLSGLSFARAGSRDPVRPVDDAEVLGTADAFLARVRAAAGGGR